MLGIFVSFIVFTSTSSRANSDNPMQLLQQTQKQAEAILKANTSSNDAAKQKTEEQLRTLIQPFFDFQMLASQTLHNHWSKLKPEDQKNFSFWFEELLKQAYIQGVHSGLQEQKEQKYEIKYLTQQIDGPKAKIFTEIRYEVTRRGRKRWQKVQIDWVLVKRDQRWMVNDIITNDNSLMETYREQFDTIIAKHSFGELLKRIQKNVHKLRTKHGLPQIEPPSK
jgi:phospholipid transport system substrate-binding protein